MINRIKAFQSMLPLSPCVIIIGKPKNNIQQNACIDISNNLLLRFVCVIGFYDLCCVLTNIVECY